MMFGTEVVCSQVMLISELYTNLKKDEVVLEFKRRPSEELPSYIQSLYSVRPDMNSSVVMLMQKLSVRLAEKFSEIKKEYENIIEDPFKVLSTYLGVELSSRPAAELTPLAIILTMEAWDYKRMTEANDFFLDNGGFSFATTLCLDSLPEPLKNSFIVINLGDNKNIYLRNVNELRVSRDHEYKHGEFHALRELMGRERYVSFKGEMELIKDARDLTSHQALANRIMKYVFDVARSEIISYYSTNVTNLIESSIFSNNFTWLDKTLSQYSAENALDGDCKDAVRCVYEAEKEKFMTQFVQYKNIALSLYQNSSHLLSRDEIDAILMTVPVEEVDILRSLVPHMALMQQSLKQQIA